MFFPLKGLLLSGQGGCSRQPHQAKGKGFQSRLTFGLKITLTAGIEPCLLRLSHSSLHSPRCIFLSELPRLGLAASHSYEGPCRFAASRSYKGPWISCITLLRRTLLPWISCITLLRRTLLPWITVHSEFFFPNFV